MHFSKFKKAIGFSSLIALCSIMIYLLVGIIIFPSEIQLMAGSENNINVSSPFSFEIKSTSSQEVMPVSASKEIKLDESLLLNEKEDKTTEITRNNSVEFSSGNDISYVPSEDEELDMALSIFGIPFKNVNVNVMDSVSVVPCGNTVGVKIYTKGIMVLGAGSVNGTDGSFHRPSENKLKAGDLIIGINDKSISRWSELKDNIKETGGEEVTLKINREEEILEVSLTPVKSKDDNEHKIGVWVRDMTQGIGTLTYYNPMTGAFGALGHGILDVDTNKLMSVKTGKILSSNVVSIKKGKKGVPGELEGKINPDDELGIIKANTTQGLYGLINKENSSLPKEQVKIGMQNEIFEGPAKIISNVHGTEKKEYDVYIESVNKYSSDESKGMVVRITDNELINKTSGIVQGMSGSPIMQDGKLIGAVTHVFVQNPTKGYGIFIENMMKNEIQL